MGRHLLFLMILAGAFVVPWLLAQDDWATSAQQAWNSLWNRRSGERQLTDGASELEATPYHRQPVQRTGMRRIAIPPPVAEPTYPLLTGPPVSQLSDLIRFDVTPEWVTAHWGRVSTHLADPNWNGLRVAVCTGTELHDVTGSLTYSFDAAGIVQRVGLRGYTGDVRPLVDLVTQTFQLVRQTAGGGHWYWGPESNSPLSYLRIGNVGIVRVSDARRRYEIDLEINRPGPAARMSWSGRQLLDELELPRDLPRESTVGAQR